MRTNLHLAVTREKDFSDVFEIYKRFVNEKKRFPIHSKGEHERFLLSWRETLKRQYKRKNNNTWCRMAKRYEDISEFDNHIKVINREERKKRTTINRGDKTGKTENVFFEKMCWKFEEHLILHKELPKRSTNKRLYDWMCAVKTNVYLPEEWKSRIRRIEIRVLYEPPDVPVVATPTTIRREWEKLRPLLKDGDPQTVEEYYEGFNRFKTFDINVYLHLSTMFPSPMDQHLIPYFKLFRACSVMRPEYHQWKKFHTEIGLYKFRERMEEVIDSLKLKDDRYREIIKCRYGLRDKVWTLLELATKFKLTREWIRQIQSKAELRIATQIFKKGMLKRVSPLHTLPSEEVEHNFVVYFSGALMGVVKGKVEELEESIDGLLNGTLGEVPAHMQWIRQIPTENIDIQSVRTKCESVDLLPPTWYENPPRDGIVQYTQVNLKENR